MIARHWRGVARPDRAAQYERHLIGETVPALQRIEGFVDASIARREVEDGVEFLVITRWQSLEAIHRFAGEDAEVAVVPAAVQRMMVRFDQRATHFEVVR